MYTFLADRPVKAIQGIAVTLHSLVVLDLSCVFCFFFEDVKISSKQVQLLSSQVFQSFTKPISNKDRK